MRRLISRNTNTKIQQNKTNVSSSLYELTKQFLNAKNTRYSLFRLANSLFKLELNVSRYLFDAIVYFKSVSFENRIYDAY